MLDTHHGERGNKEGHAENRTAEEPFHRGGIHCARLRLPRLFAKLCASLEDDEGRHGRGNGSEIGRICHCQVGEHGLEATSLHRIQPVFAETPERKEEADEEWGLDQRDEEAACGVAVVIDEQLLHGLGMLLYGGNVFAIPSSTKCVHVLLDLGLYVGEASLISHAFEDEGEDGGPDGNGGADDDGPPGQMRRLVEPVETDLYRTYVWPPGKSELGEGMCGRVSCCLAQLCGKRRSLRR